MKRAFIAAAILSLAFAALPAFATDGGQQPMGQAPSFEQKQADILKTIDSRSADLQEERSCVQSAKSDDDLKACRDNHMAKMEQRRSEMQGRGGGGQSSAQGQ